MKKQKAFTLAEVLITLAIIGIVATLTIPTVINNYQKRWYSIALKKRYSELTQVVRLSTIENGESANWDWSLSEEEMVTKYIAPYLKVTSCENCWLSYLPNTFHFQLGQPVEAAPDDSYIKECYQEALKGNVMMYCDGYLDECLANGEEKFDKMYGLGYCSKYIAYVNNPTSPKAFYTLADGTTLGFEKKSEKQILYIYLDINGMSKPNQYGKDKYVLILTGSNILTFNADSSSDFACTESGNKMSCASLLKANNWEFPENYPKI